jgi:hypothetical protein
MFERNLLERIAQSMCFSVDDSANRNPTLLYPQETAGSPTKGSWRQVFESTRSDGRFICGMWSSMHTSRAIGHYFRQYLPASRDESMLYRIGIIDGRKLFACQRSLKIYIHECWTIEKMWLRHMILSMIEGTRLFALFEAIRTLPKTKQAQMSEMKSVSKYSVNGKSFHHQPM